MDIQLYEDITDRFISSLFDYGTYQLKPTADQLHQLLHLISLNKNVTILPADIDKALFCIRRNDIDLTIRIFTTSLDIALQRFAENTETPLAVDKDGKLKPIL